MKGNARKAKSRNEGKKRPGGTLKHSLPGPKQCRVSHGTEA